jgi:hypothetical protein
MDRGHDETTAPEQEFGAAFQDLIRQPWPSEKEG